jgi:hypothetical protein
MTSSQQKEKLLELIGHIRRAREQRSDEAPHLAEFAALLPGSDISNLCGSDLGDDTIVEICLGSSAAKNSLSRDELLMLVRRFTGEGEPFPKESESILAAQTFIANCKHPAGTDLIFWPDEYFDGRSNPTAEEIVEKALNGH